MHYNRCVVANFQQSRRRGMKWRCRVNEVDFRCSVAVLIGPPSYITEHTTHSPHRGIHPFTARLLQRDPPQERSPGAISTPLPSLPSPSFDGKQVFLSVKVGLPHDRRKCLDCQREVTTILGDIVAISNVKPAARSLRLRRGRLILSLVLCDEERNDENLIPR